MLKKAAPDWRIDTSLPLMLTQQIGGPERPALTRAGNTELDRDLLRRNGIWAFEANDARAHEFVMLRSQLMNSFYSCGGRILAVTSTMPREGKTFMAANLAAAFSQIHPTIAIDLDLRRPELAARFGIAMACGVDDVLSGRAAWADSAHSVTAGLTLHGVREPIIFPTGTLASDRLRGIFHDLRQLPGEPLCIVDTPPVLMLDDANLIARHIDGTLMVVDEGKTRAGDLQKAISLLAPAKIVGSVLNRSLSVSRRDIDHAYYEYNQGHLLTRLEDKS